MDLAGQTLGNYYVEKLAGRKGRNRQWLCVCLRCGEKYLVYESFLLSKRKRRDGCRSCGQENSRKLLRGCRYCGHRNSQNQPACRTCNHRIETNGLCPDCNFPRYAVPVLPLALTKDGRCICDGPNTKAIEALLV